MQGAAPARSGSPPEREPWLRTAAYVVIVVAGLRAAADLVVTVLLALLLAMAFLVPVRYLRARRCPTWLAVGLVVAATGVAWTGLVTVVSRSVQAFHGRLDDYEEKLEGRYQEVAKALGMTPSAADDADGQAGPPMLFGDLFGTDALFGLVATTANGLLSAVSSLFVILLLLLFMLLDASDLSGKLQRTFGNVELHAVSEAGAKINSYLFLKTVVSLLTGVFAGAFCALVGVDYPVLWGLIAFLFNYVPNIGSVIAALPPTLLAFLDHGVGFAAVVAGGLTAVNLVFGSLVEPRLMGRSLGLSTSVVFLSLLFWGWVLGPAGMLLSIPLTMVVKIMLEHNERYRPIAVLLGGCEVPLHAASGPANG
ncbi:MAG: AI-2E family transporter [Planctomycetota bacterium]